MLGYTPPGPEAGTPPPEPGTPLNTPPPSPQDQAPPSAVHVGRYGQQAGGTHPTGMQSYIVVLSDYHGWHRNYMTKWTK